MHKFLNAVGFSNITKKELEELIHEIVDHPQMIKVTKDSEGNEFAELSKEFSQNIGIMVRGNYEEDDQFHLEYYYPYFFGTSVSTQEEIEVQKHAEKESYAGVCDDVRFGVTLIFYLQNVADYLSELNRRDRKTNLFGAVLSGLAYEGKILLPIEHKFEKERRGGHNSIERNQLLVKAREGNEEAIESLTMEDMDIYTTLSKRVMNEDVLSIVQSCFMPYGIESDQYSIIAEILDYVIEENKISKERIICMKLLCNDMVFDVCINEKDLMGEPEVGRRFKGNVWMQGSVCIG